MNNKPTSAITIVLLLWILLFQCISTPVSSMNFDKASQKLTIGGGKNNVGDFNKPKQHDRINFAPFILRKRYPTTVIKDSKILDKKAFVQQMLPLMVALVKNAYDNVEEESMDNSAYYTDCDE